MSSQFDMTSKHYWPTTFFHRLWHGHVNVSPGIITRLYQIQAESGTAISSGVAPAAKPASGLFESGFDLFSDADLHLTQLKRFIEESVCQASSLGNGSRIAPTQMKCSIVDSWFHITSDGGFHDAHFHGGCSWCSIYYLQIGESGRSPLGGAPNGGSRFYSPLAKGGAFKDYGNKYLDTTYVDAPIRDGLLILFPSYLLHRGLPYRGKTDRIVIAFNCQVECLPTQVC